MEVDETVNLGIGIGKTLGQKYISQTNEWLSFSFLKPYFMIDNKYVLDKIKYVFMPFLHKDTEESIAFDSDSQDERPTNKFEYADLYLPLVSFTTYILILGINKGLMLESGEFSPEFLWAKASTNSTILFFYALLVKLRK